MIFALRVGLGLRLIAIGQVPAHWRPVVPSSGLPSGSDRPRLPHGLRNVNEQPDAPLPEAVATGAEPSLIVGAMAGGWFRPVPRQLPPR